MQETEKADLNRKSVPVLPVIAFVGEKLQRVGEGEEVSPCPNCGALMNGIRGSKSAVCQNCGFKDSCCF